MGGRHAALAGDRPPRDFLWGEGPQQAEKEPAFPSNRRARACPSPSSRHAGDRLPRDVPGGALAAVDEFALCKARLRDSF